MKKNNHAHAARLFNSISEKIGQHAADDIAANLPLSKSADYECKFKWASDICAYLEDHFDEKQIRAIRMDCACTPPESYFNKVRRIFQESTGLQEFADRFNAEYPAKLSVIGSDLHLIYPECYCSMVKRIDHGLSKTWCNCTLGYAKRLFDYVLACDTQVELLESVKLGNSRCLVKITRQT